jgi:hypothetical protein
MECVSYDGVGTNASCILVFFDNKDSEIKVYTCGDFVLKLSIVCNTADINKPKIFPKHETDIQEYKKCSMPELKDTKIIYLHNSLELRDYSYEKYGQIYDFSVGGLIKGDFKKNYEHKEIERKSPKGIRKRYPSHRE